MPRKSPSAKQQMKTTLPILSRQTDFQQLIMTLVTTRAKRTHLTRTATNTADCTMNCMMRRHYAVETTDPTARSTGMRAASVRRWMTRRSFRPTFLTLVGHEME